MVCNASGFYLGEIASSVSSTQFRAIIEQLLTIPQFWSETLVKIKGIWIGRNTIYTSTNFDLVWIKSRKEFNVYF